MTQGFCTPIQIWKVETTDTFGGEPNYCWRNTFLVVTPALQTAGIIRRLRAAAGLTGRRCRFADNGHYLEWRPYGDCTVTFARPID